MSGCLSLCRPTLSYRYSSYSFSLILVKLGTHDICANTQKSLEQIFKIFFFEIFGKFLKFYIWTRSLEQQQQSWLGRQASLV